MTPWPRGLARSSCIRASRLAGSCRRSDSPPGERTGPSRRPAERRPRSRRGGRGPGAWSETPARRPGARSSTGLAGSEELDAIAGAEQARGIGVGQEELYGRATDEMPAAGHGQWIDAGLAPRDRDRAGGDVRARNVPARQLELLREWPEVGPSRHEADEEDAIDRMRVRRDDRLDAKAKLAGDVLEVRPVVLDGDAMEPAGNLHLRPLGGEPLDGGAERFVRGLIGIEMDRDARIARDRLAHVATFPQGGGKPDRARVQRGVESGAQLREQGGVTERVDPRLLDGAWRWHVRSQEWRRRCPARGRRTPGRCLRVRAPRR